jgi:hypothetical protein
MKKLQNLGRALSKQEQKRIMGGNYGPAACGRCDMRTPDGNWHQVDCSKDDKGICRCGDNSVCPTSS